MAKTYQELLRDPLWQRRKSEILNRDNFTCTACGNKEKTLHVHHIEYWSGRKPWEYPDDMLVTLCEDCHEKEHDREKLETNLAQALKSKGFLVSDLFAFGTLLYHDKTFCETLLKTLRDFQNG